jgi:hypothetical protein
MRRGDGEIWNYDYYNRFTTREDTDAKYNNGGFVYTDNEIHTTGAAKLLLRTIDRIYVRCDPIHNNYSIYWRLE